MKFLVIHTWEPHERNEIAKRRMESGMMAPKGIKIVSEWLDTQGARQIILFEADSAKECFKWSVNWGDLGKYDCFPVVEVEDDKATKISE